MGTFNIGGVERTLEEAKKFFPYGAHTFRKGNLFDSYTSLDPTYPEVNINHGWKLHADLKKQLSLEEALSRVGLMPKAVAADSSGAAPSSSGSRPALDISRKNNLSFDVTDRDLFDKFKKRFHTLTGGKASDVDEDYFESVRRILSVSENYDYALSKVAEGEKYINPMQLLETIAVLGKNDINYKMGHQYGAGRMFTFYGQSLEERDRIIAAVEGSSIADYLEDVNDPSFRAQMGNLGRNVEGKNAPVSKHLNARFTTDYINTDYVDERGVPFFDMQEGSSPERIASKPRIPAKINAQGVSEAEAFKVSGEFGPDVLDDQLEALRRITQESPEMAKILHGAPGYVSPYGTIEDIIEYRTGKRIQIPGRPVEQTPDVTKGDLPKIEPTNYDAPDTPPKPVVQVDTPPKPVTQVNAPPKPVVQVDTPPKPVTQVNAPPKAVVQVGTPPKANVADQFLYDDDIPYSPARMDEALRQNDYVNLWTDLLNEKDEKIRLEKLAEEEMERERVAAKKRQQKEKLEERDRLKAEKKRARRDQRNQPGQKKPNRKPTLTVGEPVQGANQTAVNVVNSGTGTPQRAAPQAAVTAQPTPAAANAAANAVGGGTASRGASTAANLGSANASSRAVVQGASGSKNLRVLGAAAVAGLLIGGHAMFGRTQQDNINRRLEMQRKGIIS